jgi:hypothetical protein
VAAALFALWVGFLAFLALGTSDTTVLSRPQFLLSTVDVIAQLDAVNSPAQVKEVVWSRQGALDLAGQPIKVVNLPASAGWQGPGLYILPLLQHDGVFEVAPLPRSPGFVGTTRSLHPPRIYRLTPETRTQLEAIRHAGE